MKQATRQKMSMMQIVGYGSGCLGANLMNNTVSSFISFYYTEVAGLPLAVVGVILLACRLLDGVSDLVMGAVVERTYTKEGKARPWVKRMAIPFGLSIFLMFFSPSFGMTGKIIWAVCTYVAGIAVIYTAVMVPYNTLSAVSTEDVDERTKLVTARNMFGFVGPLAIGAISMPVVNFLGAGQLAWSVLTGIYGVLGALCYLWVYFSVKEVGAEERYEAHLKNKENRQAVAEQKEQRNVLDDLKALGDLLQLRCEGRLSDLLYKICTWGYELLFFLIFLRHDSQYCNLLYDPMAIQKVRKEKNLYNRMLLRHPGRYYNGGQSGKPHTDIDIHAPKLCRYGSDL